MLTKLQAVLQFATGILQLAKQRGYIGGKLPSAAVDVNTAMERCLQEALRAYHPLYIAVDHIKALSERAGVVRYNGIIRYRTKSRPL